MNLVVVVVEMQTFCEPELNKKLLNNFAKAMSVPHFDVYFEREPGSRVSHPGSKARDIGMEVILDKNQKSRITVTNWGTGSKQQKVVSFTCFDP